MVDMMLWNISNIHRIGLKFKKRIKLYQLKKIRYELEPKVSILFTTKITFRGHYVVNVKIQVAVDNTHTIDEKRKKGEGILI